MKLITEMKATVKYFGMIAEKIGCVEEVLEMDKENLRNYFETKYPEIKGMNYKIAVNQVLTDVLQKNNGRTEIALLPPFAGG